MRSPGGRDRSVGRLALLLAGALGACGPSAVDQRSARLEIASAQLEKDPSAALFTARDALQKLGEDPRLDLVAAMACVRLGRRSEAVDFANAGLAPKEVDEDLRADLEWVRGTALMGRYKELKDLADWRSANSSLERATQAGHHRAEAATLLVGLQDMGTLGSTDRQLKYARLLFELEPDGAAAASVRALLEQKGLSP